MKENIGPLEFYQQKINSLEQQLKVLYKRRTVIAWARFLIFILVCIVVYIFWKDGLIAIIASIVSGIALFLIAVSKDADNKNEIKNLETLLHLNEDEINYFDQNFIDKYDGKDLEPPHHTYAKDLDVFGPSSLFQYINRCWSEQGIKMFAERLLQTLSKEQILQQQQSVQELNKKIDWWQQFQAYGINEKITVNAEKKISKWLEMKDEVYTNVSWKILLYVYPVITLSCFYLFLDDILPTSIFSLLLLAFFVTGLLISARIQKVYQLLSKLEPVVATLFKQVNWFEREKFESDLLMNLQQSLRNKEGKKTSSAIKELQNILSRFDVRLNVFGFFILNTFFLWDLWQMIALNKWKSVNKLLVSNWFNAIALIEITGSFAALHFNNPGWTFPLIVEEHFTLSGEQIGHPLIIKEQSVVNDFFIDGVSRIDLITGSNMAGKSTFLRSIGVNMILAYAGCCVCAKNFTVSIATLMSSMRIEDNLAENTSTFYAELKKLKSIIDAVNSGAKTFILLDEFLRGTNSFDRHTGSKALIQQLVKKDAIAIIATHDIELSKLENEFPASIKNYHFDVQVKGDELFFDYTIKDGVCKSMNASVLMKQIGIEM
jgi:VIT1/CCC1 family predicted Fe2+/Mn2+ transporter